tara:strand:+ start:15735 stop:16676 length:942 start_codon:yes stop_codon:yes gene_type:complete
MNNFSHLDKNGNVKMVDIDQKISNSRVASARGKVSMNSDCIDAITNDLLPKGNVLTTAKVAAIQAAKKTSEYIPLCHQLNLSYIDIEFEIMENSIHIKSMVKTKEATGVEMEALNAVSAAALTIYDMCKAIDKKMIISDIYLIDKKGGKSDQHSYYSPKTAVLVLSQSVYNGKNEDVSGQILIEGLSKYGCNIDYNEVIPDDSDWLVNTIKELNKKDFELVVTSGGTGIGPYDITIDAIKPLLTQRLPGVEQALHSYGRNKISTAMLSRLLAGRLDNTFIICIPGSPGAAKDAITVLMPSFLHVFQMISGARH